jgi:transcriptional regulator with XRE-family HTH domain
MLSNLIISYIPSAKIFKLSIESAEILLDKIIFLFYNFSGEVKMKLGEKIKQIRIQKGLSLRDFSERLKNIFGDKALRYNTIYRIEKGLRDAKRISSLSQICIGLEVSLKELKEGTEEEKISLVDYIKKRDKPPKYIYSSNARLEILSKEKQPFLAVRLVLLPAGKTNLEQDPIELGRFEKWIYGLKGRITCLIGQEKITLAKDEIICFESNIPHYFENNTAQKASCIIIQNPKHI